MCGEADVEACNGCGLYYCQDHFPGVKFDGWGHACTPSDAVARAAGL